MEIENGSLRDQLSFPTVLSQLKDRLLIIPHQRLSNFFKVNEHLIYEFKAKSSVSPFLLKVVNRIYGR